MSDVTTVPFVGACYVYQSGDTIAPVSTSSDPDLPLENIIDPNDGPNTGLVGRTADAGISDGWKVTLATQLANVFCVEAVDVRSDPTPTGLLSWLSVQSLPGPSTVLGPGLDDLIIPSEVWTQHDLIDDSLIRPNWIAGVDDLVVPAKKTPPGLTEVSVDTVSFTLQTAGTNFFESAFCGIGINGRALPGIDLPSVQVEQVELFKGWGHRLTVRWAQLPDADAVYLQHLFQTNAAGGRYPFFFFPAPGVKSPTGTLTDDWSTPAMRGGLMRYLSFTQGGLHDAGGTWYRNNCVLRCETWQEHPAEGA